MPCWSFRFQEAPIPRRCCVLCAGKRGGSSTIVHTWITGFEDTLEIN